MEMSAVFNSVIALIFVLCLIALVSALLRKYSSVKMTEGAKKKKGRISLVDAIVVDNKRRLILARRDDVEHLILLGDNDLLIEGNIKEKPRKINKKK